MSLGLTPLGLAPLGLSAEESSGSSGASASFSLTTEDAVFSGGATVSPVASFAVTTEDAVFSGSASVSGASPTASFQITTEDAVFSGTASVPAASGSFVTDAMINNTGTVLANTSVVYEWHVGTGVGVAPTSVDYGSGTTNASGALTATGLTAGSGFLLVASADRSAVYYQAGTVT